MPLDHLVIPTAVPLQVRLTGGPVVHPTSGYRQWLGRFESSEPIVALALAISGTHVSWTRSSHRGTASLKAAIVFSPCDEEGLKARVTFMILDALTATQTVVDSLQAQPAPLLQPFRTGELVKIADIASDPRCELKALFLARRDVNSVRNGVWHARGEVVAPLSEPWRKILTYGRTGELDAA